MKRLKAKMAVASAGVAAVALSAMAVAGGVTVAPGVAGVAAHAAPMCAFLHSPCSE